MATDTYDNSPARKQYLHEYYLRNKQKILAVNEAWWKAHPEKLRAKWRRRYWNNRDKIQAKHKEHRKKNVERYRAANREWQKRRWPHRQQYIKDYNVKNAEFLKAKRAANYAANKEEILKKTKQYVANLPKSVKRERWAKYRNANRAKCNARQLAWRNKNRGKWQARSHLRRAMEKRAAINLKSIKEWMTKVRKADSFVCYYCERRFPSALVHFDHIVALSTGGEHSVRNLCAACPDCNLSKGAKPIRLWIEQGQQLLEL